MKCHRTHRFFSPYLDGELRPALGAAVARHLASCPACQGRLDILRAAGDRLAELDIPAPPAGLADRILAAAAQEPGRRSGQPRNGRLQPAWVLRVAGAAAALLCALAGAYLGTLAAPSPAAATPPAAVRSLQPGTDPMQPLYTETFRLLPSGSPGAEYLALMREGGH